MLRNDKREPKCHVPTWPRRSAGLLAWPAHLTRLYCSPPGRLARAWLAVPTTPSD